MNINVTFWLLLVLSLSLVIDLGQGAGEQCGWQTGGLECPNKLCCSSAGYCGTTEAYCGDGCQSNCYRPPPPAPPPPTPPSNLTKIIPQELFEEFLKHRNTAPCTGGFYSYYAFITAANSFPEFGNTGDLETRKREIAAFFGQTSHETTGGWPSAPDGPQAWGYCWVKERGCEGEPSPCSYCQPSTEWPCAPGKGYYGRGPMQLSYNYNYGPAGQALNLDLLNDPDQVSDDAVVAFKAALWFWMTPQSPKPSCHDVITGQWTPNPSDIAGNRFPGYGVLINIINGGLECYIPAPDARVEDRILFYKRYCELLDVNPGDYLDCYNQRPFNWGLALGGKSSSY